MQGWRSSMEDAHTTILKLPAKKGYSYFGVYDGHRQNAAKYTGNHLHVRIAKDGTFEADLTTAIQNGFLATDDDLKNDPQFQNDPSGCTAVMAIVTPYNEIYVGNAGDSRAVLSEDGIAFPMSHDHKPVNEGNLAVCRALGDFEFKRNKNLHAKDQIITEIKFESTEFLVLACDGIWECLSSQDVVSFIRKCISENKDLHKTCEDLMERCLAKGGELDGIGYDNMTVIIVGFLHNKTEKEWYEWMAKRYGEIGPEYKDDVFLMK
ncbi:23058_t:CDS:2 [Gigaspora margarita]|uniref:protein-serine/threonine phosphatase n=1 Tax=Gigaspora margarita TaxID=4874 RepID=A0ABN7VEP0_GIGMA|nr:23058_t:CDS:2 [Gigaspora margarita]